MFVTLQVGALLLAAAYLLLTYWPRRGKWARTLPLKAWLTAGWGAFAYAMSFLGMGLYAHSKLLLLTGLIMGAAFALAVDNYWSAESYQRKWGMS